VKKEIRDKWLKALRSGNYEQTTNCLKDLKGYCCLGVLCEIARDEKVVIWDKHEQMYGEKDDSDTFNGEHLPEAVSKWAGLDREDPTVNYVSDYNDNKVPTYLSGLNDKTKLSFKQIADLIEEQL